MGLQRFRKQWAFRINLPKTLEEFCTSAEAADDYGHEGQQVPDKYGSISEQFGGSRGNNSDGYREQLQPVQVTLKIWI